jgi:hypothetical protein
LTMTRLPNHDSNRNDVPFLKRRRTCLTCGARLERKRLGRLARYCSDRCRDKAYEGRNFSVFATARIRDEAIRRNSQKIPVTSKACEGDFAGRGSVFSVPLDLIGHASFSIESIVRHCGSTQFIVGVGAGPHAARSCCWECGVVGGARWLARQYTRPSP